MFSNWFQKTTAGEQPGKKSRRVEVGWLLKDETAGVIWDTPKPVSWNHSKAQTSKSVQACPAVIQYDRLHYVINSPVDLHLRINKTSDGKLQLQNVDGDMSSVRPTRNS